MHSKSAPIPLRGKTAQELAVLIAGMQAQQGGKVAILTIYFDPSTSEHVCWYYPLTYSGAGIF